MTRSGCITNNAVLIPAHFVLCDEGRIFSGYRHPSVTWNGWECPLFTSSVRADVLHHFFNKDQREEDAIGQGYASYKEMLLEDDGTGWEYYADKKDGGDENITPSMYHVEGIPAKVELYNLGGCFCWTIAEWGALPTYDDTLCITQYASRSRHIDGGYWELTLHCWKHL